MGPPGPSGIPAPTPTPVATFLRLGSIDVAPECYFVNGAQPFVVYGYTNNNSYGISITTTGPAVKLNPDIAINGALSYVETHYVPGVYFSYDVTLNAALPMFFATGSHHAVLALPISTVTSQFSWNVQAPYTGSSMSAATVTLPSVGGPPVGGQYVNNGTNVAYGALSLCAPANAANALRATQQRIQARAG